MAKSALRLEVHALALSLKIRSFFKVKAFYSHMWWLINVCCPWKKVQHVFGTDYHVQNVNT